MADFRSAVAVRRAMGDAGLALIDAGSAAGRLRLYAGAKPASPNDALSGQTLLATLALSDPAFGPTGADGIAAANAIASDTAADADGTASFFRIEDSAGVVRFQGDVSATGGGGDLELPSTSVAAGVGISISSFTVTVPEG